MGTRAIKTMPPLPMTLPAFGGRADAGHAEFDVYAEADAVRVRLIHPGTRSLVVRDLACADHPSIWHARITGDFRGWTYTYEVTRGDHTEGGVLDPYASLISHGACVLVDDETPVAPAPPLDASEAVLYELHVRDFTNHPTAGVRPEWRGTYLGLTEPGTVCARAEGDHVSTALDHIRQMGVTVVQLMPVHTFAYVHHSRYDWGYMPSVFGSPHEPYASETDLMAPVREFKQLVSALHESGIRVTIDMVTNHTHERWPSKRESLMCLAPKSYFRFNASGEPSNGSGTGNELATEHPVCRDLIVRCCERWVRDFGVDGFRFDLMGLMDMETIGRVVHTTRALKPDALIYGEPWAGGDSPARITHKGDQRGRGFAVFNDDFRDAARGNVFDEHASGFLTTGEHTDAIKRGVRGSVETFAESPLESINYLEVHDNHTLADRIEMLTPGAEEGFVQKAIALGAYTLLTSCGMPLLHAGQEIAREQSMIGNAYDRADAINNVDWSRKLHEVALVDLHRALIALRLDHPILRHSTRDRAMEYLKFLDDDLGITLPQKVVAWETTRPDGVEDTWARACVILNGSREVQTVALPDHGQDWMVSMIGFEPEDGSRATDNRVEVPGVCGAVVYQLDG